MQLVHLQYFIQSVNGRA